MKNGDSHIWLYAKHHYKRTDIIKDLKKILAERSGTDVEYVGIDSIFIVLCQLVFPHLTEYRFLEFITDSFKDWKRKFGHYNNITSIRKVLERMLSILANVKVKDKIDGEWITLVELDEPDYSILPKRKGE